MKTLEETVKEQGGEEFLAMVKEVRKRRKIDENEGKPVGNELVLLGRLFLAAQVCL